MSCQGSQQGRLSTGKSDVWRELLKVIKVLVLNQKKRAVVLEL